MGHIYRCLNCGFIFSTPEIRWFMKPINPGNRYILVDPRALYYSVPVCPKCSSDAIRKIGEEKLVLEK